jgi:hypothetical protein
MLALCQGPIAGVGNVWDTQGTLPVNDTTEYYTLGGGGSYEVTQYATFIADLGCTIAVPYTETSVDDYGSPGPVTLTGTNQVPLIAGTDYTESSGTYYFNVSEINGKYPGANQISINYSYGPPNTIGSDPITSLNFTFFNGAQGQAAWSWLTTNYPNLALGYTLLSYAATPRLDLGTSGALPNLSFEILGLESVPPVPGSYDCNPSDVLNDLLTNAIYGCGFVGSEILQPVSGYAIGTGNGNQTVFQIPAQFGRCKAVYLNATLQSTSTYTLTYSGGSAFLTFSTAPGSGVAITGDFSTQYSDYCLANGILFSPKLDQNQNASEYIDEWLKASNSELVRVGFQLVPLPYGDTTAVGNGATFSPATAPIYSLDDDDFVHDEGEAPVIVKRPSIQDAYNSVKVSFTDRANNYNANTVEAGSQWAEGQYKYRPETGRQYDFICQQSVAALVAETLLARMVFIRNTYSFKTRGDYIGLNVMDIVEITDTALGLNAVPVRITNITENDDKILEFEAEQFPWGCSGPTLYPKQPGAQGGVMVIAVTSGHGGTGYAAGDRFQITGAQGAIGEVTQVSSGAATAVQILAGGSGYSVGNGYGTIAITGSGAGLEVNILQVSGTGLPQGNADPGFTNPPLIFEAIPRLRGADPNQELWFALSGNSIPVAFVGGGGSGAAGYALVNGSGAVYGVVVTQGGSGYTSGPSVQFGGFQGGVQSGSGATATASISGGSVSSVAVTAGGSGYQSAWGGCHIWLSTDGENYTIVGTQQGAAIMGKTTADWPAASDPDSTNDLPVDLTESNGTLPSVSTTLENSFASLFYVSGGFGAVPYELGAYGSAVLTGPNKYTLKATGSGNYLRRNVFGAPNAPSGGVDHPSGSAFCLLNQNIFKLPIDPVLAGQTLYVKLTAFNNRGNMEQSLASVPAYVLTPQAIMQGLYGYGYSTVPTTVLTQGTGANLSVIEIANFSVIGTPGVIPYSGLQGIAVFDGQIQKLNIHSHGTGYAVGDTFVINGGGVTQANGIVVNIGPSGSVLSFQLWGVPPTGLGYSTGSNVGTTTTSGSGSGLTVDITAVSVAYGQPWTVWVYDPGFRGCSAAFPLPTPPNEWQYLFATQGASAVGIPAGALSIGTITLNSGGGGTQSGAGGQPAQYTPNVVPNFLVS